MHRTADRRIIWDGRDDTAQRTRERFRGTRCYTRQTRETGCLNRAGYGEEQMMIQTPDIERPPRETIMGLQQIGSATAVGELSRLGIRDAHLRGITSWTPWKT